jgi:hypothetical protein
VHGHDVTIVEKPTPACLGSSVDLDIAFLDQEFGVTSRRRGARELQKRPKPERTSDADVVQLLSLIGMMR